MTTQPRPAGSYNGNQGKDDYHQCVPAFSPPRLLAYHPTHPFASAPATLPRSPLRPPAFSFHRSLPCQPLFKLNRSPTLHFPLLNLAAPRNSSRNIEVRLSAGKLRYTLFLLNEHNYAKCASKKNYFLSKVLSAAAPIDCSSVELLYTVARNFL